MGVHAHLVVGEIRIHMPDRVGKDIAWVDRLIVLIQSLGKDQRAEDRAGVRRDYALEARLDRQRDVRRGGDGWRVGFRRGGSNGRSQADGGSGRDG